MNPGVTAQFRIALVEDGKYDVRGIREAFAEAGFPIEDDLIFRSTEEAEGRMLSLHPDLALVDLALPKKMDDRASNDQKGQGSGLALIGNLIHAAPDLPVVAISRTFYPESVFRLLLYGVSFLDKDSLNTAEEIHNLITAIRLGRIIYSNAVVPQVREACRQAPRGNFDDLDMRILRFVIQGETDRSMSSKVNLGEDAIGARLVGMYKALGYKGRENRLPLANWVSNYYLPAHDRSLEDP